jgi:hypothetical protein
MKTAHFRAVRAHAPGMRGNGLLQEDFLFPAAKSVCAVVVRGGRTPIF